MNVDEGGGEGEGRTDSSAAAGAAGKRSRRRGNLSAPVLPVLRWDDASRSASLETLFRAAESRAVEAIAWYMKAKAQKGRASRLLRGWTLVIGGVGGLFPLVAVATDNAVNGQWGYVFLASAAALVAFDRFFGLSSGWMRFLSAALVLRRLLETLQIEWAARMAQLGTRAPTDAEVDEALGALRAFSLAVADAVEAETHGWVAEFQSALSQFDRRGAGSGEADGPPRSGRTDPSHP